MKWRIVVLAVARDPATRAALLAALVALSAGLQQDAQACVGVLRRLFGL